MTNKVLRSQNIERRRFLGLAVAGLGVLAVPGPAGAGTTDWIRVGTETFASISAGYYHVYGQKADGTLNGIGSNAYGQLAHLPHRHGAWTLLDSDTDWKLAVGGFKQGYLLKNDGRIFAVGGTSSDRCTGPTPLSAITEIGSGYAMIAAGGINGYALKAV